MLRLQILYNKRLFDKPNGDNIVDLIGRSVSFINLRSKVGEPFVATGDFEMRPDLIAHQFYGNSNQVDLLLKYNGYSNPFAVESGSFLFVPEANILSSFGSKPAEKNLEASRKKQAMVTLSPTSKKDKRRADFLLKKNAADGAAQTAPPVAPNVALDKGVKIQNGQIVYGNDVTSVKKEDCPDPISRTRLMQALVQNKTGQ